MTTADVQLGERLRKPCSRLAYGCAYLAPVGRKGRAPAALDRIGGWLDQVYAAGCTVFDTAKLYGVGNSERALGAWCRRSGLREQIVIATKGCFPSLGLRSRINARDLKADLRGSLERLQSDYTDIYFLHRDDPRLPVGEIVELCHEEMQDGAVRMLGVSNWTHERIAEATRYAAERKLRRIEISSPHFSLAWWRHQPYPSSVSLAGAAGEDGRAWYTQEQMPVFAWAAMAQGFFQPGSGNGLIRLQRRWAYGHADNRARRGRAEALAKRRGLTAPQVALAYLVSQPFPVLPIVSTTRAASLQQNMAAVAQRLTLAEIAWLERGGPEPGH
jgi:aryl-alcohol dehydrogenase-like predicted oxidoreductase